MEKAKNRLEIVKKLAIVVGIGALLWIATAAFGQESGKEQRHSICYPYASLAYQVAQVRDLGVDQKQVIQAILESDFDEEQRKTDRAQRIVTNFVTTIYVTLRSFSPEAVGNQIYQFCMGKFLEASGN